MKVVIVTPVFNDWDSLTKLSADIETAMQELDVEYTLLAVNDDSPTPPQPDAIKGPWRILHLTCNLGHQRAIAVGLAHLAEEEEFDAVVVMDADGEDRPDYIPQLIERHQSDPDAIVVARRDKRSEGRAFRLGYQLYQLMFRVFTGRHLPFGNFCLLPADAVRRLVFQESLWNHLAATILRSRFRVVMLGTARGARYAGRSTMNTGSLVLLGLSAIAVYSDIALMRTLLASFMLSMAAIAGIVLATFIRLFTEMAIPGWASGVVGSMSIILVQCLVVSVFLLFIVLANRSQRGFIAARHYHDYVMKVEALQSDD
jgi:glycosyltransferase involved in cell wall biosynthesis